MATSLGEFVGDLGRQPVWDELSAAAQKAIIAKAALRYGIDLDRAPRPARARLRRLSPTARAEGTPPNLRVSSVSEDLGLGKRTTQSEPSLAAHGDRVVVGWNDWNPGRVTCGYAFSSDVGRTFDDAGELPPVSRGDPVVLANRSGHFHYAALVRFDPPLEPDSEATYIGVARSADGGRTFGPLVDVSGSANGARFLQDKEWIAVDASGQTTDGALYVSWVRYVYDPHPPEGEPMFHSPQILFVRSTDRGDTWSSPLELSAPGGAPMPAVGPAGEVYVGWRAGAQMLVRRSDDGGASFGPAVVAATLRPIGERKGNIRAQSNISLATDGQSGAVCLSYASLESAAPDAVAGVYSVVSRDRGAHWSTPLRVHSAAPAVDRWMPSVAVTPAGVVGVMFYDRRHDPANNLAIDVYLALSRDGGRTFPENRRITSTSFPPKVYFDDHYLEHGLPRPKYMGDYNHIVAPGERFLMAWGDNRDMIDDGEEVRNDPNVYFAAVDV